MTLAEAVGRILDFSAWKAADQIRFFCWFLHSQQKREWLQPGDAKTCFDQLGMEPPTNVGSYFASMVNRSPKQMLKSKSGYKLEKKLLDQLDKEYGHRASTVAVADALAALPEKISDIAEREYIREAIICFKHKAFRAAIVMTWNVAYDHLVSWILTDASRLSAFNSRLATQTNPGIAQIKSRDDFTHLKESVVLTLSRKIVSEGQFKVLEEKLDRRNAVAHPGGLVVHDVTAEEFIRDLIDNVVLKLV